MSAASARTVSAAGVPAFSIAFCKPIDGYDDNRHQVEVRISGVGVIKLIRVRPANGGLAFIIPAAKINGANGREWSGVCDLTMAFTAAVLESLDVYEDCHGSRRFA